MEQKLRPQMILARPFIIAFISLLGGAGMFYKLMTGLAATLLLFGMVGTANADLFGDVVGCNITGGGSFVCDVPTAEVVNPVEFHVGNNAVIGSDRYLNVNLFGAGVRVQATQSDFSLGGTIINLTDLDWIDQDTGGQIPGRISGFTLFDINGGVSGFGESDVTFGDDYLSINLIGTTWNERLDGILIRLQTEHSDVPIPEPGTLILFGSGLAGLGLWRWRKSIKA